MPAPKKAGEDQAIGRSRGRLSTKIHTLVDTLGNPVGFHLTGGQAHDLVGADHLLPDMQADVLIADKAFDADERVIQLLDAARKTAVIPPKANRRLPRTVDRHLYKARHLIENFFAKLKQFRAIATRYDKTARNFLAAVYLAASTQVAHIAGYNLFSLTRASAVVNCQSALVWFLLRRLSQAATSLIRVCLSGIRRSRHCPDRTLSSDSAMFSQLPCLGV